MKENIQQYIQNELVTASSAIEIDFEDDLLETGMIDSVSIMRLITYLEKEFSVKIPPKDMIIDHFMTIEAITRYLTSHPNNL